MTDLPLLAVFGAEPRFAAPLPLGQCHWPAWERYEAAARGIFARRYYTAQRFAGPLVVEFQRRLQDFLGVKHAVVVRNATNGLMIATHSLGLQGKVIVPSWTHIATVQSLLWSKCQPVFCDIDPETQQMSLPAVRRLLESGDVRGILGVHLWGSALPVSDIEKLADAYGIPLYCDAAHAFGCQSGDRAIGAFGRVEVFSFHEANILSTAEGGCMTTNDDALADKLRAMRGDHVAAPGVSMQSATARMSEIQAAIGMMMLDDFDRIRRSNEAQHRSYQERLRGIPGIKVLEPTGVTRSNFQYLAGVVDRGQFGLGRDEMLAVLKAENVAAGAAFHPPTHEVSPFSSAVSDRGSLSNTEAAAQTTFQLPIGAHLTADRIRQICDIIRQAHIHAQRIKSVLAPFVAP